MSPQDKELYDEGASRIDQQQIARLATRIKELERARDEQTTGLPWNLAEGLRSNRDSYELGIKERIAQRIVGIEDVDKALTPDSLRGLTAVPAAELAELRSLKDYCSLLEEECSSEQLANAQKRHAAHVGKEKT